MTIPEITRAYPGRCPECGDTTANNVVIITDPETAETVLHCCSPGCDWQLNLNDGTG